MNYELIGRLRWQQEKIQPTNGGIWLTTLPISIINVVAATHCSPETAVKTALKTSKNTRAQTHTNALASTHAQTTRTHAHTHTHT